MLVKRQAKRQFHDRTGPLFGKQEALFIFLNLVISRVDRLLSRSIDAKKRRRFHMPSSLRSGESVMTLCRRSSSQIISGFSCKFEHCFRGCCLCHKGYICTNICTTTSVSILILPLYFFRGSFHRRVPPHQRLGTSL